MTLVGISMTEFRTRLREEADRQGSIRALARSIGVSGAFLTNVLSGSKRPGPKVLKYMGYEQVVTYTLRHVDAPTESSADASVPS